MRNKQMQKRMALHRNSKGRKARMSGKGVGVAPRQGRRVALRHAIAVRKESSPCKILPAEAVTAATLFDSLSAAQKGKLADLQDALSKMWD